MGYSVYAKTKDKKLQEEMFNFLDKNMKNYVEEFFGDINLTGIRLAKGRGTRGLSYVDNGKQYPVGFDYGPTVGIERFYVTEITKWITIKIGDKKHYYYDGEKTKIINSFESNGYMKLLKNECNSYDKRLFEKSINFIENEIKRLDNLWNKGLQKSN